MTPTLCSPLAVARHRSMTYVAAGVTAVAFGLYYSVFRQKYGGYPFRFIF